MERRTLCRAQLRAWHSREVGLQHEHGGGVAEGADGAHAVDVVDHELVRLPHVCARAGLRGRYRGAGGGEKRGAPFVRSASAASTWMAKAVPLRRLLLGSDLASRDAPEQTRAELDSYLNAIAKMLPGIYEDTEPTRQAQLEIDSLVAMDSSKECLACKRAMLLYAILAEPGLASHWQGADAEMAADLHSRVLPFVTPRFIGQSAQAPEAFLQLSLVLSEMWRGERLSNFPLHHDGPGGELRDAAHRELRATPA